MSIRERLSGNEAASFAMKQINPDVVAAFPITPSTEIPQYFSTFVANGTVDTEFVAVESEHSAMSACIGAEAAGARAMTATSSNGLSFMWEMIYIASSLRLPIVMNLVNRHSPMPEIQPHPSMFRSIMTILMLWVFVTVVGLCYFLRTIKRLMIIYLWPTE